MTSPCSKPAEPDISTSPAAHNAGTAIPPPVSSTRLLGQQGSLHIDHRGAIYTLRATSKGGLILTK
ncbi:MAG: hemin uptake protein HemP [Burkholderiales bacterium]|nr:hemin uptake protein HemP [Burkholderiales bacterium]